MREMKVKMEMEMMVSVSISMSLEGGDVIVDHLLDMVVVVDVARVFTRFLANPVNMDNFGDL